MIRVVIVAIAMATGLAEVTVGDDSVQLRPSATASLAARAIWAQSLGPSRGVLVAMEDRQLLWLDVARDKLHVEKVSDTHSGPIWGGECDGMAYVYDRYAVYAIDASDGNAATRLQWRIDDAESFESAEADDPEFLTRFLAVAATRFGACVVRSDGNLGLLDRADGHMRWRREIPALREAETLRRDDTVALLYSHAGRVHVQVLDVSAAGATVQKTAMDNYPLAKALSADGLLIASEAGCFRLVGGELRSIGAEGWGLVRGATVAFAPGERGATQVWSIDAESRLQGWDLAGRRIANQPLPTSESWRELRVDGGHVVAIGPHTVCKVDLRTAESGDTVQRMTCADAAADQTILDAQVSADQFFMLTEQRGQPPDRLSLAAWPLPGAAVRPSVVYALDGAGHPRLHLWRRDRLWLFEGADVRVYTLPEPKP